MIIADCLQDQGLPFEENNDGNNPDVNDEHKPDGEYKERERNSQFLEMNGSDVDQEMKIDRSTRRKKRKEWTRVELK